MRSLVFVCLIFASATAFAADLDLMAPAPAPQPPVPPAAAQPVAPAPEILPLPKEAQPAPQGESWWRTLLRSAPQCRSFSDGCRTCDREFSCSGLPIACQPREWTCADPKP